MSRRAYYEDMRRCPAPKAPPDLIGVTLISPGYVELGTEAIQRMKHFAGLDTVATFVHEEPAFFGKFDFPEMVGRRRVVFFDADLWIVEPVDFSPLRGFWGVHEMGAFKPNCFVAKDCEKFKIPKEEYYNTGLLLFDLDREDHRDVFKLARYFATEAYRGVRANTEDRTDQSWINLALSALNVERNFLPFEYNFFDFSVEHFGSKRPEKIIGYHAAGVQLIDKLEHLRENTKPLP